jgi:hypothetical protein
MVISHTWWLQARDVWAQALLRKLVNNSAACSRDQRLPQIEAVTEDLSALVRKIQFSNVADRPGVASFLRERVLLTLDRLASSPIADTLQNAAMTPSHHAHHVHSSGSEGVLESSFGPGSSVDFHSRSSTEWSDPDGSPTIAAEELRFQEFFPTDASFVNAKVKELFFAREQDAKSKVRNKCFAVHVDL